MVIRKPAGYIAECDVCRTPLRFGRDGDEVEYTLHFATRIQAMAGAVVDNEWTDLGGGRIACRMSDPAHDDARDAAALAA